MPRDVRVQHRLNRLVYLTIMDIESERLALPFNRKETIQYQIILPGRRMAQFGNVISNISIEARPPLSPRINQSNHPATQVEQDIGKTKVSVKETVIIPPRAIKFFDIFFKD